MFHLLETSQTTYFIKFYTSIRTAEIIDYILQEKRLIILCPQYLLHTLNHLHILFFSMLNCFPFYEQGRQGIKELCNLAKVTHLSMWQRWNLKPGAPSSAFHTQSRVIALKTLVHQSIKVTENAIDGIFKNQKCIAQWFCSYAYQGTVICSFRAVGAVALSKPGKAASSKHFRIISLLLDII